MLQWVVLRVCISTIPHQLVSFRKVFDQHNETNPRCTIQHTIKKVANNDSVSSIGTYRTGYKWRSCNRPQRSSRNCFERFEDNKSLSGSEMRVQWKYTDRTTLQTVGSVNVFVPMGRIATLAMGKLVFGI